MKNYVITIKEIERSVQSANRCIKTGKMNGMEIEQFPAISPMNTNVYSKLADEGIEAIGFQEEYSRLENCIAAFLSHYTLWNKCIEAKETFTIFEHDAYIVQPIDDFVFDKVVSLGKPSYGGFNTPSFLGVGPLVSKRYFPGAHAYRLTPEGARVLVEQAKRQAKPTDVFLNTGTFPFLQEYYPWPVEARDSFTTIQKTKGCLAKHSYGETYEIL